MKANSITKISAATSAAFKIFVKGQQFVYAVEATHNATGLIGDGITAIKIGHTTNLFERFRSYLSLTTNLAAEVVLVKDSAKAERIIHAALKEYSLGREIFKLEALEAFRRIAATL